MDNQPVIDALAALLTGLQKNVQVLQQQKEQAALISYHEEHQAAILERHGALLLQLESLSSQISRLTTIVRELVSKSKPASKSHNRRPAQGPPQDSVSYRPSTSAPFRSPTDYSLQRGSVRGQYLLRTRPEQEYVQRPKIPLRKILCYACRNRGHLARNCPGSISVSSYVQETEPSDPSERSRLSDQLKLSSISEAIDRPVSVFSMEDQSRLPMIMVSIARVGNLSAVVSSASGCSMIGAAFLRCLTVWRPKAINHLVNVNGTRVPFLGYVDLSVRFKESVVELKRVIVVPESFCQLILGLDWLKATGAGIRLKPEEPRVELVPRTAVVGFLVTDRGSSSTPAILTRTNCLMTPQIAASRPPTVVSELKQIPKGKMDSIRIQSGHEGAVLVIGRLSREKVRKLLQRLVGSCHAGAESRRINAENFKEYADRRILARFRKYIVRVRPIQAPPWPRLC